jgi:hypothetical protein
MRYVTDILQRYQGGWNFVGGALAANLEGYINAGIFRAGIDYNNRHYNKQSSEKDFKGLQRYAEETWNFADIELVYNDQVLKFGCSTMFDDGDGSFVAPPPVISFKRTKNIGITVIDDSDESEIIENFGINSWEIDVRGVIVDMQNHLYPQRQVQELSRFFAINDIIEINSPLFNDMGICSIWFKEQTIEPVEAFPDTIKYTFIAKSIRPAEFSILNGI